MSEETKPIAELIKLPLSKWKLCQCIILDWYDAPLEGFCELESPTINFYFKAFATNELSNKDSFLYKVYITSDKKLIADFRKSIRIFSNEEHPFWNPLLRSNSSHADSMRSEIDNLINSYKSGPQFLIHSENMKKFLGIWKIIA